MMANVLITVGNNGTDVPNEVIEAINAIMRSGISVAHARHTAATPAPYLSFRVGKLPIVKTLGSGYLAWMSTHPEN